MSNIPLLSNLLEKVAVKRLVEHLNQNELHEKHQSAYKSLHSTETTLLHVHNDNTWALDNNKGAVFIMLDLSADSDTIDQNQLLDIMDAEFAVKGKSLSDSWFRTYLKIRTQQIGTTTSKRVPLHYGVSQGSVLGPMMFTLLTTPLQRFLKRHGIKYHKYADDLQLFIIFDPDIPGNRERAVAQMDACVQEITQSMAYR